MPSPITTHVLDTARGVPAADVAIALEFAPDGEAWRALVSGATNADGRLATLLPDNHTLAAGTYRLTFETGDYFAAHGITPAFFPRVRVEFAVPPNDARAHYHVPLLLSPYGYSTYRGS